MAIEAVKIPQNVYVEDRIIGPVTLKQLVITGVGAGISYIIFATVTKAGFSGIPTIIICWIPAYLAASFAFLKINDLSLFNIILLFIENMNKSNIRYWSPHPGLSINLVTRQSQKEMENATTKATKDAERLMEITKQMQKRQEEMNRLSMHDQRPDAVDAVQTRFEKATTIATPEQESAVQEPVSSEATNVDVSTARLDPTRSIDSVKHDLESFDRLMADTPH
jgi:hypothetical protein